MIFCVSPSCSLTNLISNIFVHHLCVSGKTDITGQSSINGCVCYQSNWDISSSISAPNVTSADQCSSGSKSFCVKHRDICSEFETTFTSGNCSSFNITTNIIVGSYKTLCLELKFIFFRTDLMFNAFLFLIFSSDLYNSSEIELSGSTGLPAVIQPTLPKIKECKHITVNYTCSGKWNIRFMDQFLFWI